MKKVLIVSDTHKYSGNILKVIKKEKPLDMLIHLGDAEGKEDDFYYDADCPVYIVAGNNDYFSTLKGELEFNISDKKAFITHGHYYYVSMGVERLVDEAKVREANMAMYGHTHRPFLDIIDNIVVLNPGSISYPRQADKLPSYMIMEIDDDGDVRYTQKYWEM